jgi:hypothetical protein
MFQVFDTYVAIVSFGCCTCFTIATHMFSSVSSVFANVSDVCCKYFRNFGHILQVFHLNVSKVDQNAPHVAMCPTYHNLLLHLLGIVHVREGVKGWSAAWAPGKRREMAAGALAVPMCAREAGE